MPTSLKPICDYVMVYVGQSEWTGEKLVHGVKLRHPEWLEGDIEQAILELLVNHRLEWTSVAKLRRVQKLEGADDER